MDVKTLSGPSKRVVTHPFEGAGGWWFLFGCLLNVHPYLPGEMIQSDGWQKTTNHKGWMGGFTNSGREMNEMNESLHDDWVVVSNIF